jgi:hypothetical protein
MHEVVEVIALITRHLFNDVRTLQFGECIEQRFRGRNRDRGECIEAESRAQSLSLRGPLRFRGA